MADIDFVYAHSVDIETAKKNAGELIDGFVQSNAKLIKSSNIAPDGLSGQFKGKGFEGKWSVDEQNVRINMSLSFMLKPLKGKILSELQSKLKRRFPEGHQV